MNRIENQQLNALEYEERKTVLCSLPQFLVIELTQGCNLACPMCRSERISVAHSQMSDSHFDTIAHELFETASLVDLRGWGESLILPRITYYISRASAAGCRIRIVSNLSFHRPEILESLASNRVSLLCSLDSPDAEILGRLRGGAQLHVILSNLERLARLYDDIQDLGVLCTVQAPALPLLPTLPGILADVGLKRLDLSAVSTKDPDLRLDFESSFAANQLRLTIEACEKAKIAVNLTSSLPGFRVPAMPRCMRPWTTMHINVRGQIGYCDHLIGPYAESELLGHVSDGVRSTWNSNRWQRIRSLHNAKAPAFRKCRECYRSKGTDLEHIWTGGKPWIGRNFSS